MLRISNKQTVQNTKMNPGDRGHVQRTNERAAIEMQTTIKITGAIRLIKYPVIGYVKMIRDVLDIHLPDLQTHARYPRSAAAVPRCIQHDHQWRHSGALWTAVCRSERGRSESIDSTSALSVQWIRL